MKVKLVVFYCWLFFPIFLMGQSNSDLWWKKAKLKVKPVVGFQLWSSYTFGQEVFDEDSQQYKVVADRLNFQLRRSRFGIKGQGYEQLFFNLTLAIDLVGRDVLSGTEGGANNGSFPLIRLWNAYIRWQALPDKEILNITLGYFPLQIGRESITSAFRSNSMEKAWSQNYLRRHLTGIGPGRAVGLNIGGLIQADGENFSWGYDVGLFNPVFESYSGNSIGEKYAPLLVGRLAAYLGDPESKTYTLGHKVNYFGKRYGLTLAVAGAQQGETDLFQSNSAFGFDFLFNWGPWNVDGDWHVMERKGIRHEDATLPSFLIASNTGYFRLGYNVNLENTWIIEPVGMVVCFNGETEEREQNDANLVKSPSGREKIYNLGFNVYFNPDLKLSLHYTHRVGDPGAAGDGALVNNYFSQKGVGAIRRGDWLGLGVVAIF